MKPKQKITGRERWIMAVAPALLVIGVYVLFFVGDLYAELEKTQKRVAAANVPLSPAAPSATLAKAKSAQADVKRSITEREARVAQLEATIATLPKNGIVVDDNTNPVHLIEQMEAVFARNGITPQISEATGGGAGESQTGNQAPAALVSILAPKIGADPNNQKGGRVWHCIFNDLTPRFERALKELEQKVPAVVPLSLNLVYNPDNDGETRLLELWLLY